MVFRILYAGYIPAAIIIIQVGGKQPPASGINNIQIARYEHIVCNPFQSYAVATLITGLQGMCVNVVPHVYVKCPAV